MGNSPSSHAKEYHDDLTRLAEERHATRQREKEKGLEDDNKVSIANGHSVRGLIGHRAFGLRR